MATQVTAVDKFVTVNGLRLHYLDWGNEAAPVVEDSGPATSPPAPGTARISREVESTPATFPSWAEAEAFMRQLRPSASDEGLRGILASSLKELPDGSVTWKYDL